MKHAIRNMSYIAALLPEPKVLQMTLSVSAAVDKVIAEMLSSEVPDNRAIELKSMALQSRLKMPN